MGALIGGFLIGRPFALFRQMFRDAAERGNPLYGAAAFSLQSLGNILILALLFLALTYLAGGRLQRWLAVSPAASRPSPRRRSSSPASSRCCTGMCAYSTRRDIIPWYPVAPWA